MTLKTLASIVTLAVNRSQGVEILLGHFSLTEFFTIIVKLSTTMGNLSPHQRDVVLRDIFLPPRITECLYYLSL